MPRFFRLIALTATATVAFTQTPGVGGLAPNLIALTGVTVDAVARDAAGAIYAAGQTANPGLATPGAYQSQYTPAICEHIGSPALVPCSTGLVAKLSPGGEIVWETYLGGTDHGNEMDSDSVEKVLLDSLGNVWVSGQSNTLNFPITPNAYQTSHTAQFLAELSPDGSHLLYSTFTSAQLLAIGPDDAVYLGGASAIKLDPSTYQLLYNTVTPFQAAYGLVGNTGILYLAGSAGADGFPISPGVYSHPSTGPDIALTAIDPSGNVIFSTIIGGAGGDVLDGMTQDAAGNLYLAGFQQAVPNATNFGPFPDFPVTPDAIKTSWSPAFLLELPPDALTLLYGTFLGNGNVETESTKPPFQPQELKLGSDGKLRMVGFTEQSDIPLMANSFLPCYQSGLDARRWTYLQFSSGLRSIEYATATPGITSTPFAPRLTAGPFYFDATGDIYLNASPTPPYFSVLNVSQSLGPGPACLADFVTQATTNAAPGLLVSILGNSIGPDQPATLTLGASGKVTTQLAGTQVLFDGIPAPILSTAPNRIDAVVPFGVAISGTTTISVLLYGTPVGFLTNSLAEAAPKLFTQDGTGYGAAAWNQDGTPNSPANPAQPGDIVTFYGTGVGPMIPTPADGAIPQSPKSVISLTPDLTFCHPATYAGDAPGLVEGIFQYNCEVYGQTAPFSFYISGGPDGPAYASPQIYTLYVK